jgi:glycosyltransferase involved in cell wall biosynthesis
LTVHIGFSLVDLAMGGAQAFFVQLAKGLAAHGHSVSYWLAADLGDPHRVQPALKGTLDGVARRVRHPWDLWRAGVIHLDGYHSLRRKLAYLPRWNCCVETYHSAYSVRRAGPLYPRHRVAVSGVVQALLPAPTRLIHQGVSFPAVCPASEKRFDVAILGRMHPVKNHRLFLAVCEELYLRRGRCSALLIGGAVRPDSYQQEIDAEIRRLQKQGVALYLAGDVPPGAIGQWLSQVRVLLVTSRSEGFGRMAVDAMAYGVPVVANPVGGLFEVIQPGVTGFLAEKDQVGSFVAQTSRLLDDDALRRAMGQRGRALVAERFSLERMVADYEALYREIAGQA